MSETLVVNVFIPSLNKHYDVRIPLNLRMEDIAELVAEAVSGLSRGEYMPNHPVLCNKQGGMLRPSDTPRSCNLHIGSQLILI